MASKSRSKVVEMPRHPKKEDFHYSTISFEKEGGSRLAWQMSCSKYTLNCRDFYVASVLYRSYKIFLFWIVLIFASHRQFGFFCNMQVQNPLWECNTQKWLQQTVRSFSGQDPQQWSWLTTSHASQFRKNPGIPKSSGKIQALSSTAAILYETCPSTSICCKLWQSSQFTCATCRHVAQVPSKCSRLPQLPSRNIAFAMDVCSLERTQAMLYCLAWYFRFLMSLLHFQHVFVMSIRHHHYGEVRGACPVCLKPKKHTKIARWDFLTKG